MALKHHTVIFVPHSRAKFRKFRLSNRQLVIGSAAALLLLILALAVSWSFFTSSVDKYQLAKLADENQQLRAANQDFEADIRDLKTKLADFEERTRQLAIVAGLDGSTLDQGTGIGGGTSTAFSGEISRRLSQTESKLESVEQRLAEQSLRISATPSISPVKGVLTSGFGNRPDPVSGDPDLHRAIDISTSPGMPVVSTADGVVIKAEREGRLGNAIYVSHGFGFTTRYGHLDKFQVVPGQRVNRGDVIGFVGNTGRTTGYHLHYEVRVDGRPVNPMVFILSGTPSRS